MTSKERPRVPEVVQRQYALTHQLVSNFGAIRDIQTLPDPHVHADIHTAAATGSIAERREAWANRGTFGQKMLAWMNGSESVNGSPKVKGSAQWFEETLSKQDFLGQALGRILYGTGYTAEKVAQDAEQLKRGSILDPLIDRMNKGLTGAPIDKGKLTAYQVLALEFYMTYLDNHNGIHGNDVYQRYPQLIKQLTSFCLEGGNMQEVHQRVGALAPLLAMLGEQTTKAVQAMLTAEGHLHYEKQQVLSANPTVMTVQEAGVVRFLQAYHPGFYQAPGPFAPAAPRGPLPPRPALPNAARPPATPVRSGSLDAIPAQPVVARPPVPSYADPHPSLARGLLPPRPAQPGETSSEHVSPGPFPPRPDVASRSRGVDILAAFATVQRPVDVHQPYFVSSAYIPNHVIHRVGDPAYFATFSRYPLTPFYTQVVKGKDGRVTNSLRAARAVVTDDVLAGNPRYQETKQQTGSQLAALAAASAATPLEQRGLYRALAQAVVMAHIHNEERLREFLVVQQENGGGINRVIRLVPGMRGTSEEAFISQEPWYQQALSELASGRLSKGVTFDHVVGNTQPTAPITDKPQRMVQVTYDRGHHFTIDIDATLAAWKGNGRKKGRLATLRASLGNVDIRLTPEQMRQLDFLSLSVDVERIILALKRGEIGRQQGDTPPSVVYNIRPSVPPSATQQSATTQQKPSVDAASSSGSSLRMAMPAPFESGSTHPQPDRGSLTREEQGEVRESEMSVPPPPLRRGI